MGFEQVFDKQTFKHMDALSKQIQSLVDYVLSPGGGYSYIFPYGDVPLNRVSFSGFRIRDRVSFL